MNLQSCHIVFALLIALVTGGCAETVVLPADAPPFTPAPSPTPDSGKRTVYLYRLNAGHEKHSPTVYLDGQHVATPPEGSYTWFQVNAGKHTMVVDWPGESGLDLNFEIEVQPEKDLFLRLLGSFAVHPLVLETGMAVEPVEEPYALAEMRARCRYVPSE